MNYLINAPRQVRNLIVFPSLGLCLLITTIFGRFSAFYLTAAYIALFIEGLSSIAKHSCTSVKSDFRSEWIIYKSNIMYLITICGSNILSSFLEPIIGWYVLWLFGLCFGIYRLYFYEVGQLVNCLPIKLVEDILCLQVVLLRLGLALILLLLELAHTQIGLS